MARRLVARLWALPLAWVSCAGVASSPGWRPCAFVANDHGQVLREWLDAAAEQRHAGGPLTVLHVDKHGDLNVPDADLFEPGWLGNATRRGEIASAADLANFQQAAAWAGLVDRVIWVRQGGGPMERFLHLLRVDGATGAFDETVLSEEEERRVGEQCSSPVEDESAGSSRERRLRVDYVPEEELDRAAVLKELQDMLRSTPWILDFDLDFFVPHEAEPGRPPWCESAASACGGEVCRQWPDPGCPFWQGLRAHLAAASDSEPLPAPPAAVLLPNAAGGAEPPSAGAADAGESLAECMGQVTATWRRLPRGQREAVKGLLSLPECLLAATQLSRRGGASMLINRTELQVQLSRLEELFTLLRSSPPVLVTVARSVDSFARIFDIVALEEAAMGALGRAFGADSGRLCSEYAPGTAPLPALAAAVAALQGAQGPFEAV